MTRGQERADATGHDPPSYPSKRLHSRAAECGVGHEMIRAVCRRGCGAKATGQTPPAASLPQVGQRVLAHLPV